MKQLAALIMLVHFLDAGAQDLHFSQYNENPALLNPALTGAISPIRAALTYKDQWRSVAVPYQTYGASFEKRFALGPEAATPRTGKLSRLGAGLAVYNDKAGDAAFGQTRAMLSLAGFIPASRKSYISAGLQAAMVQRKLNQGALLFPSQYNGAFHDPSLSSGENFAAQSFIHPEVAAGFLWSYAQDESRIALNDHMRANAGLAVYRLNKPAMKFLATGADMSMKMVVHGEFLFCKAQSNVAYVPSFLVQIQGASREIVAGAMVKYYMKTNSKYTGLVKRLSMNFGCYYRNRDAFILSMMYEKEDTFAFGISYDVNVSQLSAATASRGGIELAVRYAPRNNVIRKVASQY